MLKSLLFLLSVTLFISVAEAKGRIYYRHVVELSAAPISAVPKDETPVDPEIQQANNEHKKRTQTADDAILDLVN